MLRRSAVLVGFVLIAVSASGQEGAPWRTGADVHQGLSGAMIGTVTSVSAATNRFRLQPDAEAATAVMVYTDAISTQYNGFGGTINDAPEIFVGSAGFANVRVGDRVEVRGTGAGEGVLSAAYVTLLGRPVPASQTGVGQTRPPTSISPPTVSGSTEVQPPQPATPVEGIVRQVNADEGRIVMETDQRRMITVRVTNATPVYYRNSAYHTSNLEPGDRIRVEPQSGPATGEVRARTITVVQSAQESGGAAVQVGALTGRVIDIDRANNRVRVDSNRGTVTVDLTNAEDTTGQRIRAADLQTGDRLDLSGNYDGDTFVASTVRFLDEVPAPAEPPVESAPLGAVTIYGTVSQSLADSAQLVVRDTQGGAMIPVYVVDDFIVRTKSGGTTTAARLKAGDSLVLKAYRDASGNYIAQTIRLR